MEPDTGPGTLHEEAVAALGNDSQKVSVRLPGDGIDLKEYLASLERDIIKEALDESNGVVQAAAELLGMRRTTLVEKIKRHNLKN